ncbi:MAG: hypothetical protein HY420_01485 [Candidatus Kerfeldbacteria bacterium]|nr:hypothetical protein [Candidatus Kerfeldbacteria bacterium]
MYQRELQVALTLARRADKIARRYYKRRSRVRTKRDQTSVTAADQRIERVIVEGLLRRFPRDRIVGEEFGTTTGVQGRFWTIDPIDGTNQFVQKTDHFCVMIGLVVGGRSVLGVIAAPALGKTFYGAHGHGSFVTRGGRRRRLCVRHRAAIEQATLVVPFRPRHGSAIGQAARDLLHPARRIEIGSIGLPLTTIAEGRADADIRTSLITKVWDYVPGQIILEEAGGIMSTLSGLPLRYRWGRLNVDHGVVAAIPELHPEILRRLRSGRIIGRFLRVRRQARAGGLPKDRAA